MHLASSNVRHITVICCRVGGQQMWAFQMRAIIADLSQMSWMGMTGSPVGKGGREDLKRCIESILQVTVSKIWGGVSVGMLQRYVSIADSSFQQIHSYLLP